MSNNKHKKSTAAVLQKFGIDALNPMQEEANIGISTGADVVLLSPTGTGKTLAFLLPLIQVRVSENVMYLICWYVSQ